MSCDTVAMPFGTSEGPTGSSRGSMMPTVAPSSLSPGSLFPAMGGSLLLALLAPFVVLLMLFVAATAANAVRYLLTDTNSNHDRPSHKASTNASTGGSPSTKAAAGKGGMQAADMPPWQPHKNKQKPLQEQEYTPKEQALQEVPHTSADQPNCTTSGAIVDQQAGVRPSAAGLRRRQPAAGATSSLPLSGGAASTHTAFPVAMCDAVPTEAAAAHDVPSTSTTKPQQEQDDALEPSPFSRMATTVSSGDHTAPTAAATTRTASAAATAAAAAAASQAAVLAVKVPPVDSQEWATQLKTAASRGDSTVLEACLLAAASAPQQGSIGSTSSSSGGGGSSGINDGSSSRITSLAAALQEAVWGSHDMAAKLLLGAGAPAGRTNDANDNTPLHLAARHGAESIARALLAAGASPRATNRFLQTPLHTAAAFGHLGVARMLLSNGALVDAGTQEGTTPLAEATQGGHGGMVALLLSYGADPLRGDAQHKSPLYWAAVVGSTAIVQQMCDRLALDAGLTTTTSLRTSTSTALRSASSASSSTGTDGSTQVRASQATSAIRSCAMAAVAHGHMPAFATLARELARRDPAGLQSVFEALGTQYAFAAAAAVAVAWADETAELVQERAQLQAQASGLVAERVASQQLLVAIASAAKQLEQLQPVEEAPCGDVCAGE